MSYLALRHLHIACVILSVGLLVVRAGLLLSGQPRPRVLRWLPHVNDTVLLSAAVGLAVWSGQYPLQQSWLTAKVVALVIYILLGRQALREGLAVSQRLLWLAAALACVGYIASVAVSRNPLPF